jgi:hypothetical protein
VKRRRASFSPLQITVFAIAFATWYHLAVLITFTIFGNRTAVYGGLTAPAAHAASCSCVAGGATVLSSNTVASHPLVWQAP